MSSPQITATRFQGVRRFLRWFVPGLGVKRWLLLALAGMTLLGVGLAIFLLDLYRTDTTNQTYLTLLSYASLRFLPRWVRIVIFGGLGLGMTSLGIWELNRSLMRPYMRPGFHVVDQLTDYRRRERGPRIVALGGGHGLSTLLRGLKNPLPLDTARLQVLLERVHALVFVTSDHVQRVFVALDLHVVRGQWNTGCPDA